MPPSFLPDTARARAEILRSRRPAVPAARLCRHQHRRHHAGRRPDARRLLCALPIQGRAASPRLIRAGRRAAMEGCAPARRALAACSNAYLDKDELAANALDCTLAALLPGDVARARRCPPGSPTPTSCYAAIGELARGKKRKLDADATVAAILAVGAVTSPARLGRYGGSATGCCAAPERRGCSRPALPRASPKTKRSRSRRKAAGARRSRRAARSRGGRACSCTSGAFFCSQAMSLLGLGELVVVQLTAPTAFSPASMLVDARRLRHSSFSATVFSRNSASGGILPKRSTSSAAKAVDLGLVGERADAAIEAHAHRRGRRRIPRGSAPGCRD